LPFDLEAPEVPAGCAIAVLIAQPVMNQISAVLARNDNMSLSASWFAQYYLLVARVDQRARLRLVVATDCRRSRLDFAGRPPWPPHLLAEQ